MKMSTNSTAETISELNNENYNRERETALFYYKIAYTEQTTRILIPTNICISNFIEYAKAEIYDRLNINKNLNIELVEAGQGNRELRDEDGEALQLDFNTTVRQKYNGSYDTVAFYIRILQ